MNSVFNFFTRRHLVANIFTITVLLLGASTLMRIQRDSYPTVDFGEIIIQTTYPGASPEDVELKVTNKIEEELDDISGIDFYLSYSFENVSILQIRIDPDEKDQEKIKRDVRDAVDRVTDFPEEVTESPLITELNTAVFPIIEVGLAGDIPYRELRELSRRFEKKLERVPGVSRVARFGWRDREILIDVAPDDLSRYQVPLYEIVAAIQQRNVRSTAGSFESYTSEKNIVTLAQFRDPMEVEDVIVRSTFEGPVIRVRDVANVSDDFEQEKIVSRVNGTAAISFIAYKSENADIVRTVDAITRLVEKEKGRMPEGVELLYSNDTSRYVKNRFSIVFSNGAIGLCLVTIVLALFLNVRMAFWVAVGIPVTLFGTIFLLPLFDVYLDSITLTALILVLGIVVDDAIIISESIYESYAGGLGAYEAGVEGVSRVFKPVLTTILTTLLAFAPMFFMPGMMGKFVFVIPLTVTLALLISLAEVVIALPAHLAHGLRKRGAAGTKGWREHVMASVRHGFAGFMRFILRLRYPVILLFMGMLAGAFWFAANYMEFVLFPSTGADQVYVRVELPVGSSLEATSDKLKEVERIIEDFMSDEVDSFTTRVGIDDLMVQNEIENTAVLSISLTPFASRIRTADQIVEDFRERFQEVSGIEEILFEVDSGGPPVGRPITVRVVGSDDELRTALADELMQRFDEVAGVKDMDRDDRAGKEQFEIKVDYTKLARLGLSVSDLAQNVRIAYDGEVVTTVRYGEEDVDFRVQFEEASRKSPDALLSLAIPNNTGRLVPLRNVVELELTPGPNNYYHYDGERAVTVEGDVDKEITTPLLAIDEALSAIDLDGDYPGIRLIVGGEADETQKSVNDLIATFAIAILGIYFLLILLFNSVTQPLLVVLAIPFGMIGVIIAFAAHGAPFGFLAMMGVIGLAGVVVNDSLVLVNHVNELRREQPGGNIREVVAEATANRLRAIVMTSLTTVAGLLPLAYGLGGVDPYMSPMALALGWGIFSATPLTLLLVPSMYLIGHDVARLFRMK